MNKKEECLGDGQCLIKLYGEYYKKTAWATCIYHCKPNKCPTYEVCGNCLPQCELDVWGGHCAFCEVCTDNESPKRNIARPYTR